LPLYPWECEQCTEKVEVLREHADYEREPEVGEEGSTEKCAASKKKGKKHKWDRKIGVGQSWNRNYSDGGKGHW
jgi:hypothetical protein